MERADPRPNADLSAAGRRRAAWFGALLVAATLAPVVENWRENPRDDFPFSHYPMFSSERRELHRQTHAVGITEGGERVPISHRRIGTGGANAVRRQLSRVLREGSVEELQSYCDAIAARVAASDSRSSRAIQEVRLVSARYDLAGYFLRGEKQPVDERVLATARVPRASEDLE